MLNNRNCQSIADAASNIIGYSILLTGNDGIVLGSSEQSRVGTLHEASLMVIRSGCQLFHDEQQARALQGTRPGTTIPIVINDEVVGTIGITGQPEEISKYGILIKKLAEVFLRDQLEMESTRFLEQSRQNLLRELITYDAQTMEEKVVLNHGYVMGYDLLLPRAAVMVEIPMENTAGLWAGEKVLSHDPLVGSIAESSFHIGKQAIIKKIFNHKQDLCVSLGDSKYIIFAYLDKEHKQQNGADWITFLKARCNSLLAEINKTSEIAWLGIGSRAESLQSLKDSYNDANQAIYIAKRRARLGMQYINDVYFEKLILSLPNNICNRIYKEIIEPFAKLKEGEDYIKLVICWCENRFNFTQTAKDLNIHKNTLLYRFAKFKDATGFDLYDVNSTLAMYMVIMYYNLYNI